ncbi:enoyl-CoA hydratase [Mangrovactinospora gilvigrisea]|uniref:Enoyl-CoA hydratase n=1 Tax=Mangrovactinospora gilvigrisea TaxID=1428644 RepID=A0A1J7BCW0_9ACTN|nr:enoyl-CoA hydratase-related protein [Mangrovactinospora gilvigrisea]OIV36543.1 enoyl-CoA hydratase [Mangrovactinospora gilvigrisea]
MSDTVRYEVDGSVAAVTIDRPDAHNALDGVTKVALREAVEAAASDDSVRAVLLTGTGRAFCTGQDLKEHSSLLDESTGDDLWRTLEEHYEPIARALLTMPKPVVAAVNGVAAGAGASFAFACDLRVAAESARFATSFAAAGLAPDSGMSWTLQRLVGAGRAKELLMRGRAVDAAEALRIGLVTEVVPDDAVLTRAAAVARELAEGPTRSFAAVKDAVLRAGSSGLEDALATEGRWQRTLGATEDHRAAVDGFLRKERPLFRGR